MTDLKPNRDEIREHLGRIARGAESLVIVTIKAEAPVGQRSVCAKRFRCDEDLLSYVVVQNSACSNIYFCSGNVASHWQGPNPPEKLHVESNSFSHADVDFLRPEESADEGRARVLREMRILVTKKILPEPSLTVFTGGGLQFYWFFHKPIAPAHVEPRNLFIAAKTCGDHTQNCNRLLRIAGTVNFPNAKKLKRGRVPVLSTIVREGW